MVEHGMLTNGIYSCSFEKHRTVSPEVARSGVDAVVIDLESTLTGVEFHPVCGALRGNASELIAATNGAMNGDASFTQKTDERLILAQPTQEMAKYVAQQYCMNLEEDAVALISALQGIGKKVFISSGGFLYSMRLITRDLSICPDNIDANEIFFDSHGKYAGWSDNDLTAQDGGKQLVALRKVERGELSENFAFIGDGTTDMAVSEARMLIAYTGVVARSQAKARADVCVDRLAAVFPLLVGTDRWDTILHYPRNARAHPVSRLLHKGLSYITDPRNDFICNDPLYEIELRARLAFLCDERRDPDIVRN